MNGRATAGRFEDDLPVVVESRKYLQSLERRYVIFQRIVELEVAFFIQHQQCHADDRLGHGIDPEQIIGLHGAFIVRVAQPVGLLVNDVTIAGDQCHRARYTIFLNGLHHEAVEPFQALCGQSHPVRRGDG